MEHALSTGLIRFVQRSCVWPFDRLFTSAILFVVGYEQVLGRQKHWPAQTMRPGRIVHYDPNLEADARTYGRPSAKPEETTVDARQLDAEARIFDARRASHVNSDLDLLFSHSIDAGLVVIRNGEEMLRNGYRTPIRFRDKVVFLHTLPDPKSSFWSIVMVALLTLLLAIALHEKISYFSLFLWVASAFLGSVFVKAFERSVIIALNAQQYLMELSMLNDLSMRYQKMLKAKEVLEGFEAQANDDVFFDSLDEQAQRAFRKKRLRVDAEYNMERIMLLHSIRALLESSPARDIADQLVLLRRKIGNTA